VDGANKAAERRRGAPVMRKMHLKKALGAKKQDRVATKNWMLVALAFFEVIGA
jgi:hypothetical protein